MKSDPALDALVRRAEEAGSRVLRTVLPELGPAQCPDSTPVNSGHKPADSRHRAEAPGLAPGRHEFVVMAWRPATLNELTKKSVHWATAAKLKRRDRVAVGEAALIHRVPKAIRKRRVSVEVTMAGGMRPIDPDGIWKSLCDALVAAGLLVDDSARWCELGSFTQTRGAAKATRIVLTDLEDLEEGRGG